MLTRNLLDPISLPRTQRQYDVDWRDLRAHLDREKEWGFEFVPEYQRGHVWTREQKVRYIEHVMLGGETAKEITAVCVGRGADDYVVPPDGSSLTLRSYSLLDGLQRATAILEYCQDEFPVLSRLRPEGYLWSQADRAVQRGLCIRWRVVAVPTYEAVLDLYIRLNDAGTPHSSAEIERVKALRESVRGRS